MGVEPADTQRQNVFPSSSPAYRFTSCPNPPRLPVYYYELLSTGVNWDRDGELGQAEGMGTIPKTNRISLLILERKGVPIRPILPNSPQLSQSTPWTVHSVEELGSGFGRRDVKNGRKSAS